MSVHLTAHYVKSISASTVQGGECKPHITLNFRGKDYESSGSLTLYLNDAVLNERLIRVINKLVRSREKELSRQSEAA
jgi:hypothetical protein